MSRPTKPTTRYWTAVRHRAERRVWAAERARRLRGGRPNASFVGLGKLMRAVLVAPDYLTIHDPIARSQLVEFLENLRSRAEGSGWRITVDLSGVERVAPSGAVLLLAEVDRAIAVSQGRNTIDVKRAKDVVDQVFQQIDLYKRFDVICEEKPSDDSVIHWRSASGVISDGTTGGSILLDYEGRLADGLTRGLYDGVVEAMTNTVHHAYQGNVGTRLRQSIGRRWWMLSQEKDGMLTVAICDLGIGIPRSLPRSPTFSIRDVKDLWRSLGLNTSDGSAIEVAVRLGESRTGQQGRGHGLAEIVRAVNLSDRGGVFISSNRGIFTAAPGEKNVVSNHSRSIHGTLIYWAVPVGGDEGVA